MKRTVPLLITATVGFILVVAYFTPFAGDLSDLAMIHFDILAAIAFILGGGNLLRTHGEKIYRRQSGWGYSAIALGCFFLMLAAGLFKIGVSPVNQGYWSGGLLENGETVGLVQDNVVAGSHNFLLTIRKAEPETSYDVVVGTQTIGQVQTDERGWGDFQMEYSADGDEAGAAAALAGVQDGTPLKIGSILSGTLTRYSWITGDHNENGAWFWFLYAFAFQPLQQTTFAMLAFYVASAAFRAFRAKNFESVLLLGTAFLILMGRTAAGAVLTTWGYYREPDGLWEQFLSFWYMPNLSDLFMNVFNTAGNRAIMIGIALGVASTSLKVLLGIDRSYLGSDKG